MDKVKRALIQLGIFFITVAILLMISRWYYGAIANSDMPDWLKWVLLRG